MTGLAKANALYEGRDTRARELRARGRKVIGYVCNFAPVEILEAGGVVPYRIRGDVREPVTRADQYVEPYGCPFVHNTFELAVKDRYDFLDGIVMAHACDSVQRMYGIWTHYKPLAFSYLFNVPHTITPSSERFFYREIQFFRERIEAFTGTAISDAAIREARDVYNANRALVRDLYELRRQDPPLITGTELLEVLIAGTGVPAVEFHELLTAVKAEVASRPIDTTKRSARLLFYGCINDDVGLVRLVEECGARVVMDDTCIGARGMLGLVPPDDDPLRGFVSYYFTNFQCPRTFRGVDLSRFDYLVNAAREFDVDGVVLYMLSFCDPHKFDVVDVQRYLAEKDLPSLLLEDDYTLANTESMRTRLQAFVETMS